MAGQEVRQVGPTECFLEARVGGKERAKHGGVCRPTLQGAQALASQSARVPGPAGWTS